MLRLAVPFILLLLMLFAGAVWLIDLKPSLLEPAEKQAQKESAAHPGEASKSEAQELQDALSPPAPSGDGAPAFDVARIDPNGTSVFAGRAEPNSAVTITADGKEIGTVQANENGEWTFTTDEKISNPDAKLALFKAPPGARVAAAAPQAAQPGPQAAAPVKPRSAKAVTSNMIKNLEGMVAEARTNQNKQTAAAAPPSPATEAAAPSAVSPAAPPTAPNVSQAKTEAAAVPVPVTFVFNEATLTGDGRKAAGLLLEYLQIKRFPKVTLTGHADERGTEELNMNLSAERLQTVERFLREGGFRGQLQLVPKGKTEPYTGVVRSDFSQDDLYQLDRRVEMAVSR
jgi:outer membrane protein OmpA-like peptidoglycan-associated protein